MSNSHRPGFTLIEMLVVLVIMSVLLLLSRPDSSKVREAQLGENGRTNLINIYNSEKRYRIDKGVYLYAANTAAINTGLGIDVQEVNFLYRVEADGSGFKAVALRTGGGICGGKELSISYSGGAITSGCTVW